MAYREDTMTTGPTGSTQAHESSHGPSSRQIRSEIERTRREMDRDLDALEERLTPAGILTEVWGLLRGGSSAGAGRLWQTAREHPGPAAVIGVGLAWLVTERSRGDGRSRSREWRETEYRGYAYPTGTTGYVGYPTATGMGNPPEWQGEEQHEGRVGSAMHSAKDRTSDTLHSAKDRTSDTLHSAKERTSDALHSAKETVSDAASRTKEGLSSAADSARESMSDARSRASDAGSRAKEKARYRGRQARMGFWQNMEERPLAMGAATLALGVLAGLLIPSTRKEDELMGEARDNLMERAREVGQEAVEKGKQVASVAADTLKEEARREDLTPEALAEKARHVARETRDTVKDEGKRQASDLKETAKGSHGTTAASTGAGSTTPTTGGNVTSSSFQGTATGNPAAPLQERGQEPKRHETPKVEDREPELTRRR